ncbi:hypothetical protein [Mesorhizobium sp.]|uniref:hypothetical protein n=1 Tax=Mesorhizobium sp. TaxID=1871066 RepID=UPI0025D78953|nr:hypothetical protein [Mesorhizobium sp.]
MVPGIVQFFKDWICPVQRQIRLLTETENRTTRVLPNPDNSCAADTAKAKN